jgi:hypothetical protein
MLRKNLQAIAAGILAAAVVHGPAGAEAGFKALGGIAAEPMSATEMEATQGKALVNFGSFSIDNHTYLGWYHFYTATGSSYAVNSTTGETLLLINNQWFPATLFGGVTITVGRVDFGILEPIAQLLNGR